MRMQILQYLPESSKIFQLFPFGHVTECHLTVFAGAGLLDSGSGSFGPSLHALSRVCLPRHDVGRIRWPPTPARRLDCPAPKLHEIKRDLRQKLRCYSDPSITRNLRRAYGEQRSGHGLIHIPPPTAPRRLTWPIPACQRPPICGDRVRT